MDNNKRRLVILSSPSGGGKSTVAKHILSNNPDFRFAISVTTRHKRPREADGVDYYFTDIPHFEEMISNSELVEYEKIYENYYGTPVSEIEKAFRSDMCLLFDIDVKGAISIREAYPADTLLIFLAPPSVEELEKRLRLRSTETEEQIVRRMERVKMELAQKERFDYVVVNKDLEETFKSIDDIIVKHVRCINSQ
jgi:guanylate kinase